MGNIGNKVFLQGFHLGQIPDHLVKCLGQLAHLVIGSDLNLPGVIPFGNGSRRGGHLLDGHQNIVAHQRGHQGRRQHDEKHDNQNDLKELPAGKYNAVHGNMEKDGAVLLNGHGFRAGTDPHSGRFRIDLRISDGNGIPLKS